MMKPTVPWCIVLLLAMCSSIGISRVAGSPPIGNLRDSSAECPGHWVAREKAVMRVLRIQQQAWNRGDIDAFMEYYWKSKKLTFSSEGTTKRGWKVTLQRYKKKYPDREAMGKLTFDRLEVTALGEHAALVLGQWHLERKKDRPEGNFSLIMRVIDGKWVIVHDHTSSKPAE